jgi:hypothetical protein
LDGEDSGFSVLGNLGCIDLDARLEQTTERIGPSRKMLKFHRTREGIAHDQG